MRSVRLLVAAVVVATFSLAYQVTQPTSAAHASGAPVTVTGAAYCSTTNVYSRCQSVELSNDSYDSTVTTGPWGQFTFTGVPSGEWYELTLYGSYYGYPYSCSGEVYIPYSSGGVDNIGTFYCHY